MDYLLLLVFGVLGVVLDRAFGYQSESGKPRKEVHWYTRPFDALLIVTVLLGLLISLNKFPYGLLGLIIGAILGWAMFG